MKNAAASPANCMTASANIWPPPKSISTCWPTEKQNGAAMYLRDAKQLIDRAIADTRTLSHLLHPPLLDEAGFGTAARWFVEGFGSRSKITTTLEMPPNLHRLPSEIEIALFRILQEALTNVHRHSGSKKVEIRLAFDESSVSLIVEDHGKGIPAMF